MILAAAGRVLIVAMLLGLAVEARADVLELGADGARWVAGPLAGRPAAAPASSAEAASAPMVVEGLALPDNVIADPARHAAGIPPRYSAKIAELAARYDLSPSLLEAVVWHGGEAKASRDKFTALPDEQRKELIMFLESL